MSPPQPQPPPRNILRAFGVGEPPRRLAGGQGTSWIAGELVFKPGSGPLQEWLATALGDIPLEGLRVATPVRCQHGDWICDGWTATHWVDGTQPDYSAESTWSDILTAGRAFHRALATLDRPTFMDARHDWWAQADRIAWNDRPDQFHPEFADTARRLQAALEPLGSSQIVHADLTTNVLFAPGQTPAIIDVSPYWRPTAYAEGVVMADALCWHGAPASLVTSLGVPVPAVARALLFRMATTNEMLASRSPVVDLHDEAQRYRRATTALGL
ncbi:hypothetical protein [Cryptosporangium sp. NPDC048952]|uniref:hypothetical protein n=1 Tax=Cryptosporangium sp. NPDC048952 TaxID=3363961 RepID=UPI0037117D1E